MKKEKIHWIYNKNFNLDSYSSMIQYIQNMDKINFKEKGNLLEIKHSWLKNKYWVLYDLEKRVSFVNQKDMSIDNKTIKTTLKREDIENAKRKPKRSKLEKKVRKYYPFDKKSPDFLRHKCGDISSLISQAIYNEYNFMPNIIRGELYDPKTGREWNHGFIEITPNMIKGIDKKIIIDGSASQFNDTSFPGEFTNNLVFLDSNHKHYTKYKKKSF